LHSGGYGSGPEIRVSLVESVMDHLNGLKDDKEGIQVVGYLILGQ